MDVPSGRARRFASGIAAAFLLLPAPGAAVQPDSADVWKRVLLRQDTGGCSFRDVVVLRGRVFVLGADDKADQPLVVSSDDAIRWKVSERVSGAIRCPAGAVSTGRAIVAVAGAVVARSTDGLQWHTESPTTMRATDLTALAGTDDVTVVGGNELVDPDDVSSPTIPVVFRSQGGGEWARIALTTERGFAFQDLVWFRGRFIAVYTSQVTVMLTSKDGRNWTESYRGQGGGHRTTVVAPTFLYSAGTGTGSLVSTDGVQWHPVPRPIGAPTTIGWSGTEMTATVVYSFVDEGLQASRDGTTWHAIGPPAKAQFGSWAAISAFKGRGIGVGMSNGEAAIWVREGLPETSTDAGPDDIARSPAPALPAALLAVMLLVTIVAVQRRRERLRVR